MSYKESLKSVTLLADSTLGSYTGVPGLPGSADPNGGPALYRFAKITGKDTVGRCATRADRAIGVVQNKPQGTGQATTVAIFGISAIVAGEALTAGDEVTSDEQGRAVKVDTLIGTVALATSSTFAKSGSNVVVTTGAAHGLAVGDEVLIAATGNATPANSGRFIVTVVGSTTTFTVVNANGATEAATGGTVAKVVRNGRVHGRVVRGVAAANQLSTVLLTV